MANSNPYLILRRVRDSCIRSLRDLFRPVNNLSVVPPFKYNYIESAATGFVQFYGNPSSGNTLTIGSNTITFGTDVTIGGTPQITLANLIAYINAHSLVLLVIATTNAIPNQVNLKANSAGVSGNSIVLAVVSTVLRVSAPTLTQGGLFDFDNSEIFISDAIPQNFQDWPCLIVDTASASETRYLGPEDLAQSKNSFGIVTDDKIFSSLVVNVNINLYVIDDTIARDEIIDLIYNNLSEIRNDLAANGIEMIDRTMPTETRVAQDQRQYITNRFVLRCYAEWTDSLTPIINVSGMSVSVPLSGPVPFIASSQFYNWDHTGLVPFSYQIIATNGPTSYEAFRSLFTVSSVPDGTHLIINDTTGMATGDTIIQGIHSTTITTVADGTHLVVGSTTGWVTGSAVIGLPTGLILNASNGLINGTPSQFGTFYVTLSATNGNGTGNLSLTLTIS